MIATAGGDRRPRPLRLRGAVRGGDRERDHDDARRRARPGHRRASARPGTENLARMLQAAEAFPLNFGFLGKGSAYAVEPLLEQIRAGADRAQDPRGLGRDAGRDPRLARRGRRARRAGADPHRHAQRVGLLRANDGRDRRPDDPHLPLGGRRRRPRAGHHPRRRARRTACPSSTNPTNPYTRQHLRRAPRHGDGLPPPEPARARRRRVRRVAHPPRDDRGRGRAARPRRDLGDRLGLAGHGPDRRDDRAHLAGRLAHEGRARLAARRTRARATTTRGSSATSPSTRSTRRRSSASTTRSARSSPASSPTSSSGSRSSSASSPRSCSRAASRPGR